MKRSRTFLILSAFLAVSAWTSAQDMAYCWLMRAPATSSAQVTGGVENADHDCCRKEKAAPVVSVEKGTAEFAVPAMERSCCQAGEPAVASVNPAADVSLSLFAVAFYSAPVFSQERVASFSEFSSVSESASGPPRYLALRRVLI